MNYFPLIMIFYICGILNSNAAYKLIGNNQSSGAIIIPDEPNSVESTAAKELQYHLKKATGICLPVIKEGRVTRKITGGYFLGNTNIAKKRGISISKMPPNSYELRYHKNFLFIKGNDGTGKETLLTTAAGTLFGVYQYLQKALKVCWLWPGKSGEYIPSKEEVYLDNSLDGRYSPEFKFVWASALSKNKEDYRWGRRVMHMSLTEYMKHAGGSGHAWGKWASIYGKAHPEWFAMFPNGRRNTNPHASMCVSNEEFQDQIVKIWQLEQAKNKKTELSINVKENDTTNRCACLVCQSWDGEDKRGPTGRYELHRNVSERYARFYKKVWQKATKNNPAAKLSFYAYQGYFYAPRKTKLSSNFYVGLVPDIPFPRLPEYNRWLREEYSAWKASGASIYLRANYFWGGYCMPEVWYDQYASELKFLKKLGCIGVVIDGPSLVWATRGLDYYVMGRLCVEPDVAPATFVNEFLSGFGKAAPEVKAYFEYWREYMHKNRECINKIYEKSLRRWYFHGFHYPVYAHNIFPVEELEKGLPYLKRAANIVKNNPGAAQKVKFLYMGLKHAIASSRCAEVIANPEISITQKRKTWDKLLLLRKGMPRHAVNLKFLDRVEKNVWKLNSKPHGDCQELPEIWNTKADPENCGEESGYYKTGVDCSKWRKSSTWKSLKDQQYYGYGNMWYRTSVNIPEKSSRFVILHLGAVDESCKVWLNGQYVGGMKYDPKVNPNSWEEPFEVDISKWVKFGHENTICVKVEKKREGAGGLWKPSYIIYRD